MDRGGKENTSLLFEDQIYYVKRNYYNKLQRKEKKLRKWLYKNEQWLTDWLELLNLYKWMNRISITNTLGFFLYAENFNTDKQRVMYKNQDISS